MSYTASQATGGDQSESTLVATTYSRIRSDVLFGHLLPGQKLKLAQLKSMYGVGVNTLRETLSRLSADGLVVAEGQKGFRVAPVSLHDLQEVAELRQLHECYGLRRSIELGDIEWESQVTAAYYRLAKIERQMIDGETEDVQTWKRYDRDFHVALIAGSGSKALLRIHAAIFDQYLRYQLLALQTRPFRGEAAAQEHAEIHDAALARDAERATTVLAQHIQKGAQYPASQR